MVDSGIPAEDARFILPNAATTKLVMTMNGRELVHFFGLRCCFRAQWEIREMAKMMLTLARQAAPVIFATAGPGCLSGVCPEGKMCCGRADEARTEYRNL
jgi:thymidylate synthase (FAD)